MKLTELEPRWVGEHDAPTDAKQGVSFQCPHCKTQRLAVFFENPICSNPPAQTPVGLRQAMAGHLTDHHVGDIRWHRQGDTFETLTLSPSVDCSKSGHWHGMITNGEAR